MLKLFSAKNIATLCGLGYVRYAPGTVASLFTVGLYIFIVILAANFFGINLSAYNNFFLSLLFTSVIGLVGFIVCSQHDDFANDPQEIVVDELVGQLLTLTLIFPHSCTTNLGGNVGLLISFILFRFFDISKLYPVSIFEEAKTAEAIMLDDIVAAFMSGLTYYIIYGVLFALNLVSFL